MEPFEIKVSDAALEDLRARLERTRLPDQLDDAGWTYGTELGYIRELIEHWRDKFDWRKQEELLNSFDHFKTDILGLDIHFIHQRSKEPDALPIIISHGWPGSIFEFHKIIGPLVDPVAHGGKAEDAFHVICPSLPGYGFSGKARRAGFDLKDMGEHFVELMSQLGYTKYGAQGGDWGSFITTWIAHLDPEHVCGIHLNMITAGAPEGVANPAEDLSPSELQGLARMAEFGKEGTGYQRIQGTKPQTLGYGLNDSPVGLAAWIVEKFHGWTDCGGDIESLFTKDELLTNVMIYWINQCITSSTRLYYEAFHHSRFGPEDMRPVAPTNRSGTSPACSSWRS